jgi:putative ABC transport system permease protein
MSTSLLRRSWHGEPDITSMNKLDRKLLRDLLHLRGQTLAIVLVVACGVASFIALRNIYRSLITTQANYYAEYRFADVFASLKRAPDWLGARSSEIPGVAAAQTRIVASATLDVPGVSEPALGLFVSLPEVRTPILNDLHLVRGRYLEAGCREEIIISASFAEKNQLEPGASLSAIINGRWTRLQIVGVALSPEFVYEIRPGEMFPDSRRFGVIWMSRKALGAAFDLDGAFNNVVLSLAPGAHEREVLTRLDQLLEAYGGLGAYGREEQTSNHFITNEIAELRVSGTFIPAVFLCITAFLIHLSLSRLVNTQREQIAVLKAFGYGNASIAAHFLKLALMTVAGGVALGVLVGWYYGFKLTALYAEFFRFPVFSYEMNLYVIAAATAISFGAACLGALRAVQKAVALPPAEAMRPEPPARYHTGLLERTGLQRWFPLAVRIIARNLERNPLKAGLTMLGIALATSLLIVGFYFYDAIDQIIDVQFRAVYREDANVVFNEPRPARARYDLLSLPGVLRVEPYRAVPVRLRFAHRRKRTALLGLEPNSELQRIVAGNYQVFQVPPEGLVLSASLAETLGVATGDRVMLEVLEGQRQTRELSVVAIVAELLGQNAYLNVNALNQFLHESGTISGARLMIDQQQAAQLYATLKRTPVVSTVVIPEALLKNFNETIARTMGFSTATIVLFAGVIAFGMIYNGARIALSERGRELASLRVLGFSHNEISVMLLGEQGLLTLLAIPLGYAIGLLLCWLITQSLHTDLMRLPLVFSARTFALAFLIVSSAACLSSLLIRARLRRLDLVAVLKTRE